MTFNMEVLPFLATSLDQEFTIPAIEVTNLLEILTGHARMIVNGLESHQDAYVSIQLKQLLQIEYFRV